MSPHDWTFFGGCAGTSAQGNTASTIIHKRMAAVLGRVLRETLSTSKIIYNRTAAVLGLVLRKTLPLQLYITERRLYWDECSGKHCFYNYQNGSCAGTRAQGNTTNTTRTALQ